jgi:hypothetical protein
MDGFITFLAMMDGDTFSSLAIAIFVGGLMSKVILDREGFD